MTQLIVPMVHTVTIVLYRVKERVVCIRCTASYCIIKLQLFKSVSNHI